MNIFEGFYSSLSAEVSSPGQVVISPVVVPTAFCSTLDRLCKNGNNELSKWDIFSCADVECAEIVIDKGFEPCITAVVTGQYFNTNSGYYEFDYTGADNFIYVTKVRECFDA